ncbi:MAG: tyrosine-type recombinase/integrase [Actinomycetota bacterium]
MRKRRGRGEGSVYRRGGRWVGQITVGYLDGKRRRLSFTGSTKADVQQKIRDAITRAERGRPTLDPRRTVADLLNEWLQDFRVSAEREDGRAWSTYVGYETIVRLHLKPTLGMISLLQLSPADVRQLMKEKLEADLTPRRVQYIHATLRGAINWGMAQEYVDRNVASLVRAPTPTPPKTGSFTLDEARKLISKAREDRLGALYILLMCTAVRPGEALGLTWANTRLDDEVPHIIVERALKTGPNGLRLGQTKVRKTRTFPLPRIAVEMLEKHRAATGADESSEQLVFSTRTGQPIYWRNVIRFLDQLQKDADVDRRNPYALRHTLATILGEQGIATRHVSAILGHSTEKMTMSTYQHLGLASLKDAVDTIDRVLGGGPQLLD